MQGDQCLVFFLGGINNEGFSTNASNPAQSGGSRMGRSYEFEAGRLSNQRNPKDPADPVLPMPVYLDPYGRAYAYFSSYKTQNGYNRYSTLTPPSDCDALDKVAPYQMAANKYYRSDSFQIISAGADKKFGPGGLWNSTVGYESGPGADDMTNFHPLLLGFPTR